MYHIPTAYLIIGLLYIFLPFVVWLVLRHQKSLTTLLWTLGGGLLAIGMLLIAVREIVPPWVSYPVANAFAWVGILMQAMALRSALQKTWRNELLVVLLLFWLLVFEYFRQVMQSSELRFVWAVMFFVGVFCYIAYLAWRIAKVYELKSGRWLSAVYALAAYTLFIRVCRVLLNVTEPDVVAHGWDSVLTVISGLLISVVGSFTFVSMFLERAAKNEIEATELRVRQEETRRLSDQIAQLERQRTLGVMSYSFAHELSQPLTAILMDTQTIRSRLASVPVNLNDISRSIDDVERSAAHTAELIGRIRNFISPSQGNYSVVDLKVLVRDVKFLLAHDIRTLKVSFEWDFDAADCTVHGDKVQLSQIVLNVYRNAMQAMEHGEARKIFVSLAHEDSRVVMRVHDSGPGLLEELKDQVGQPFVTSKVDGLGVGLSISKTIAEMHSGSLTITNAVGGGALVELNLPAYQR